MEIKGYCSALEQTVLALWNICLPEDMLDRENFYRRVIYDVNFDPKKFLLAFEGETPAGFVYATNRKVPDEAAGLQAEQGWIVAMGVHPAMRRKEIGKTLLLKAEELLKKEGVCKIAAGPYSTNYIFPGVDKDAYASGTGFFKAMGYEKTGECCSMDTHLRGYRTPEKYAAKKKGLEEQGYRFIPYRSEDALPLFEFLHRDFAWWLPDVRGAITAGRAEKTLILAHSPEGKVIGFVLRALDGTPERFGPFGTSPSMQGKGIGTVLFHEMMENLVKARLFYTYFLWTGGRNLDIYGTWGMKIYRSYEMLSKTLTLQ